jgi:hypothetical protein
MDTTLQPIHKTDEGFFNTASNIKISLHEPTADMITIEDIAASLSKICRFGGCIPEFYSVAQHTLLVVKLAPPPLKKAAFLHDAAEAYLGDVIKPLKHLIKDLYTPLELKFEKLIFEKFNVPFEQCAEIKKYDMQALEIEHDYMRGIDTCKFIFYSKELSHGRYMMPYCWPPHSAEASFIGYFKQLFHNK